MKRLALLLLVTVAATSACTKKVATDQLISQFTKHFDQQGDRYTEELAAMTPEKRATYITLQLSKELGAKDVWMLDFDRDGNAGQVLIAEFKARDKDPHISVISACLDDPAACSAVLDVMDAFKQAKIRPANAVRAVFYDGCASGAEGIRVMNDDFKQSYELAVFDLEVSSCDSIPERTFIIEDKPVFANQLVEVIPAYIKPVSDVKFEIGDFPRKNWPSTIPTYRYRLGTPADRLSDLKVLTAFTLLLN